MLGRFATTRRFKDGEYLFQAGLAPVVFFVVRSGKVEIIDSTGDEPRTVTQHGPGEFTGDIDVLSGRLSLVSAVARGDTEVLEIAPPDIGRFTSEASPVKVAEKAWLPAMPIASLTPVPALP